MRIGDLRHKITIQEKTVTEDSEGIAAETWGDVATVWASVEDLQGREFFQAAAVAEIIARIKIRYRPGIAPAMRVLFESRLFDIKSVIDPDGRRRELQLMCREVTSGG